MLALVTSSFPSDVELVLRVVGSVVVGGLVGLERELNDHPAGVRTHIGVALGSTLFGLVSVFGFGFLDVANRNSTIYHVDPTRVASTIVSGIGFLCGGAILKQGASVKGLTTAGSLWVTAAIGLGMALGMYLVTAATAAVLIVSLAVFKVPVKWLTDRFARDRQRVRMLVANSEGVGGAVAAMACLPGVTLSSVSVETDDNGHMVDALLVCKAGLRVEDVTASLSGVEGVRSVEVG